MGRVLALIGIFLTVLYAVFTWWLIGGRIQTLQSMPLNEVGDFLAGAFGPVAILWLILGFFQQGIELRQGTDALRLQAKELSNSVVQQSELVAAQKESLKNYERSLEPLLHLEVTDAEWTGHGMSVDLSLSNAGEYCESVCVNLFSHFGKAMQQGVDPLINGSKRFVRFRNLHEWEDFEVVVDYKTRSGLSNSQKFTATHYAEGSSHSYEVQKHAFLS
jgi:hypothetical protein